MTPIHPFAGIDARPGATDRGHLAKALNLVIRSDGTAIRRPALLYRINLPTDSIGLYAIGDELRTLAPYNAGDETADDYLAPTIAVDYVVNGASAAAEVIGAVSDSAGKTVALVRNADNSTVLHHCQPAGSVPSTTLITGMGFTPAYAITRVAGRIWTLDAGNRYLRYSALDANDPTAADRWTPDTPANAPGFLDVGQFSAGNGIPTGLGSMGGRLAVLYRGAVLVYQVEEDQERIFRQATVQGPGTRHPRSVVEIGNDLMVLSEAGVRSLSTSLRTENAGEDAIGGRIDPLALTLASPVNTVPRAHYSRRLGAYLIAFGQDVLCMTFLPGRGPIGWSQWRLPIPVDAWAEAGGQTYLRSGNHLYQLDDATVNDATGPSTTVPIPVLLETLPARRPELTQAIEVAGSGTETIRVQVVTDGRPSLDGGGVPIGRCIMLPPRSLEPARSLVGKIGRSHAVRVHDEAAAAGWRLDGLWLHSRPAGRGV